MNSEEIEEEQLEEEELDAILKAFEHIDYEYTVLDLMEALNETGYEDAEDLILRAIENKILYVSSIDKDGTVYLALSKEGEKMWESHEQVT